LSTSLIANIRNLGIAMHNVTTGNLHVRAEVISNDELGSLLRMFNDMADQLEYAFGHQQELERARQDMVVAISHDLRTPLSAIRAMAESINDGVVADPDEVKHYIQAMEAEVRQLTLLI